MSMFTGLITKTDLGRAQRACEQDRTMTSLLGINIDRTISITFIIGLCKFKSVPPAKNLKFLI